MTVTREQLYQEVWAEPMLIVAARHNVSASYLARVCACLNVPRPSRGDWAKLQASKQVTKPPLPALRAGDETVWSKGVAPSRYSSCRGSRSPNVSPVIHHAAERPAKHPLLVAVKEYYDAARLSEEGYLRPRKRNLLDIFASKETLPYALNAANELFLLLEKRGHHVALASGAEYFRRPELVVYEGQKFDYWHPEPWAPGRATVVFVEGIAFGLTLYELTEITEVRYDWDSPIKYVRTGDPPEKRKRTWTADTTYKRHMPCGRLAVRAYSPYGGVTWERQWRESTAGQLPKKFRGIARELKASVAEIERLRDVAKKRAEAERLQWEANCRERERQERVRRRAEAVKESRQQLLAIVEQWSLARSIESFFEDAERRLCTMADDHRADTGARVERARRLLGGTNALQRLESWQSPEERDPECFAAESGTFAPEDV